MTQRYYDNDPCRLAGVKKKFPTIDVHVPCSYPECTATCTAVMEIHGGGKSSVILFDSLPAGWSWEHEDQLYSRGRSEYDCGYRCPQHPEPEL